MRHRRRLSFISRAKNTWKSVSYRRRQLLFKVLVGLLGSALSVLVAWAIVVLLS